MNKRDRFSATYTPSASGIWWAVYRNGDLTVHQGCAPTRRVAERDVSDAIARLSARTFSNTETRSAS
jgi:hypothetical protein